MQRSKENASFLVFLAFGAFVIGYFIFLTNSQTYFSSAEMEYFDYSDSNIIVIKPLLTANAYKKGGFYDYYKGQCDESCLSVQIDTDIDYTYDSSLRAITRFEVLGAKIFDDYTINPDVLKNYDKIILLHNEYVTQEFFDAVTSHPNVIYLYPNTLYGKVEIRDNVMHLVAGHGYNNKNNGFDWEYDNTRPYEFDNLCLNYQFMPIPNGLQLNCYPENFLMNNTWIFGQVRDIAANQREYI